MGSETIQPVALPPQSVSSSSTAAPAITLSFDGVDFKLCPTNYDSEVSYKNKPGSLVLSLSSFTGTLTVSKAVLSSLLSSSGTHQKMIESTRGTSTAPTVEDDPDTPEQQPKKSRKHILPRQQTLPFRNGKKQASKKPSKKKRSDTESSSKRRKDKVVIDASRETNSKRSRSDASSSLPPISLGQASQPTQLTQIDAIVDDYDSSGAPTAIGEPEVSRKKNYPLTKTASVQEILDRDCVQSSGESIATEKDSNDGVLGTNTTEDGIGATSIQEMEISDDNVVGSDDPETTDGATGTFSYPAPPARWGHTMTKVDNGQILVYGGQSFDVNGNPVILSDVHVYDPKGGGSWHKPINCRGEARQWHTATFIPGRQQIIAFGGETIDHIRRTKKEKVITSDTLRVLDTEIMLWYPPAASGDVPTGRSGHTATFFPSTNELILFGGVKGSKWLNTVSVLDVTRWIWTTPNIVGIAPKPRSYHSATAVGPQKMVIFGGNNKTSCFNTVHVLEAIGGGNNGGDTATGWKWLNPTIRGKAPFPRTGHTATILEDGKTIIVYGGWDPNEEDELTGEDNIFKGSYLLDTEEWMWKKGPDPQSGGSGSADHVVESCGSKRCGHTAALNAENGEVFVFGGRIPGEVLAGDVQRLVPPEEKAVELERS